MNSSLCASLLNASPVRFESDELVLGHEQALLAELLPVVAERDLALDLGRVTRIDAAGISALLALYASSNRAGHRFRIANPSPRVASILALLGLDPFLFCRNPAPAGSGSECACQRHAA